MTGEKNPLWTRDFILLSIANLAMFTGFYLLVPTVPKFASTALGANKVQIGYLVGIISLASVIIRPFAGYLLDSLDDLRNGPTQSLWCSKFHPLFSC